MITHETIEVFSPVWWASNIISIFFISSILIYGKKVSSKSEKLAKIIGLILIFRTVFIHFYWIHLDIWSIQSSLPLQLCGLSGILSGIVLLWRNQLAYECLYYWGIAGAFHSFFTPEFTTGSQGFLFYDYFISHGGIILSAIYLTWVIGMKPRKGSWWKIFLWSQFLLPIIGFINYQLDSNYMYLCTKPIVDNPFLIGDWPYYLFGVEIAALFHFIIIYLPFMYLYHNKKDLNI